MAERRIFVRYWNCLICGFLAIVVPQLLFPETHLFLIQTIDLGRKQLLKHQFWQISVAQSSLGLPAVLLVFYDLDNMTRNLPAGIILLAESWLFLLGIGCFAWQQFAFIGEWSQEVREGKRSQLYYRFRMPASLVPTMLATCNVLFWGIHVTVLGAYLSHIYQFDFAWLPGLLLLSWGAIRMSFKVRAYDRHFYCTKCLLYGSIQSP